MPNVSKLPYLPLSILFIAYAIIGCLLTAFATLWLAWLFALSAPVAGALAWLLTEQKQITAAGFMLLLFSAALAALFLASGFWPIAVALLIAIAMIFIFPVSNTIYATLTHAIAIVISMYGSMPGFLVLPLSVALPAVTAWAWAKLEMTRSQFSDINNNQAFLILGVDAMLGLAIGGIVGLVLAT
ncbi:hypothetical protein Pse7367_1661 [Thalassoporum mexicanum PCC 7367]|uniref:hypothetical protein n=1 Tax=Thalassoporum mexicanum TaxID=3457544 RepID=UPI00029FA3B1|nr:hypothetical protein [Pseudanabaena sp. PCC 7367]AFY69949.1 hypothetical protein Pse7367_1661 [Pseudanabaena sp. PCC 7367]